MKKDQMRLVAKAEKEMKKSFGDSQRTCWGIYYEYFGSIRDFGVEPNASTERLFF